MKPLTLKDIRKEFTWKLQKGISNGHLIDWKGGKHRYGYILDFDVYLPSKGKNLQRGLCWTLHQKRELILSMLKGIDIQAFSIIISEAENKIRTYKVIDGKQRLTTMLDFIDDKFSVILFGKEYLYSGLPEDIKYVITMYNIQFNQTYEYWDDMISDDDKIAWFEQINFAGTPQDIEHLKNLKS